MVTERKVNFNDNIQIVYYEKVNYEFAKNEKIKKVKKVKTVNIMKCIKKILCKCKNFM
jgi:hypothetical protein